jgi:FKBP-type peptidyl-prolyl cis-trans isomerase
MLFACSKKEEPASTIPEDEVEIVEPEIATIPVDVDDDEVVEVVQVVPGLEVKVLRTGEGSAAAPGDQIEVHYTGWMYDTQSDNGRSTRFDSSVDRGERYRFPLGEGRVIEGWDLGIEGMLVGEIRELKVDPELAYGDEGAGAIIPPGATLIFEIELFEISAAEQ